MIFFGFVVVQRHGRADIVDFKQGNFMGKPTHEPEVQSGEKPTAPTMPPNVLIVHPFTDRAYQFSCGSFRQMESQLDAICPPSICPDNKAISQRMAHYMNQALTAQKERFANGNADDSKSADKLTRQS